MKKGDKVRFLSEIGGGIVAGFQGKNNEIVLVEDEDGFQVPTPVNEVVVIDSDDYSTGRIVEGKKRLEEQQQKNIIHVASDDEDYDPADRPVTFKAPAEERKGGNLLNAYLAFVPVNPQELTSTRFETYFVNDSNYYMHFTYLRAEGASWELLHTAEVDPNTKLYINEFGREDLDSLDRICIQILAYKRKKNFILKPTVDVQLRIDGMKFYKLHTFQENDFFEQNALIYPIIENDTPARTLAIDPQKLKQEMLSKTTLDALKQKSTKQPARKEDKNAPIVVDLHINQLLDSTTGMSHTEMLNYQLDTVRKTLAEHEKEKGKKIIFIHGKGEGVLRKAVIDLLRYRYKSYPYQDASFQEYGYGATQVTIK